MPAHALTHYRGRTSFNGVGMEVANVRVTQETLINFSWNAGCLRADEGESTSPGCFLSWVLTAFIMSFKVKTIYRSLVNLCLLPTLFNTLTVSLTYWVILKSGQRVYFPDDISAFYYQFYFEERKKKKYSTHHR